MDANIIERKKVCPRCLAVFSCCTENCWCEDLPQIMPLSEFEDCLCYDCLKIEIENKISVANNSGSSKVSEI